MCTTINVQEDTAEYGARDDADPKGMQRVVDELLEKVGCLSQYKQEQSDDRGGGISGLNFDKMLVQFSIA